MKTESSHPFMLSKDIQYPMRKFGARGVYDTLLATLAIPDEQLAPVLPAGLELMDVPGCPAGRHPVVMTLGRQTDVRPLYAPWMPGMNYDEFIFSIPYVRMNQVADGYTGPFAHPMRIFVTRFAALLEGRLAGYPKLMARAERGESEITLRDGHGNQLLRARWAAHGPIQPPKQFAGFQDVEPYLHQPICGTVLGGRAQIVFPGTFIDSYFVWELDESTMRAVDGEWEITTEIIPGLQPGVYRCEGYNTGSGFGMGFMHAPWIVRGFVPRSRFEQAEKLVARKGAAT
jgi:hypothetical protein